LSYQSDWKLGVMWVNNEIVDDGYRTDIDCRWWICIYFEVFHSNDWSSRPQDITQSVNSPLIFSLFSSWELSSGESSCLWGLLTVSQYHNFVFFCITVAEEQEGNPMSKNSNWAEQRTCMNL